MDRRGWRRRVSILGERWGRAPAVRAGLLLLVVAVIVPAALTVMALPPRNNSRTSAPPSILPIDAADPRATPVSPPPPLAVGRPQFGVNAHLLWDGPARTAVDLERIAAAGQAVVRFDVQWDGLEPTAKGAWSTSVLARLDQTLDLVEARGLLPILVVVGTPAWARGAVGTRLRPPDRVEDYADALGILAARYAGRPSMAYEIWNEPNQRDFWDTPSGPDPVVYARMLQASYQRIKAEAPDAVVLGGSIAFNDHDFLERMYRDGDAGGAFDALAIHPYSLGHPPDDASDPFHSFTLAIDGLGAVMATHGEPVKPIWITEMGWSTDSVGEAVRAAYYLRAVELLQMRPRVATVCVFQLRQDQDLPDFGLISKSGAPTGSWSAYTQAVVAPGVASQPRGSIDAPAEDASVRGLVSLSGWALDEAATASAGVDRVQVFLSGTYLGDAEYGASRPDIAGAYGSQFDASGYQYTVDLGRAGPGAHTIEVRARSSVTGLETVYVRAIGVQP